MPAYAEVWPTLTNALWLEQYRRTAASAITALPWVVDGIGESERQPVQELINIAVFHESVFYRLMDRPWVQDSIDESELALINHIGLAAEADMAAALRLVNTSLLETLDPALIVVSAYEGLWSVVSELSWVKDDLDDSERTVIAHLGYIATKDEGVAMQILGMPFLQTVEPVDAGAMAALWHLASSYPQQLQRVMTHPTLVDGITDEWVNVIVVLRVVRDNTPNLLEALLDPNRVTIEERAITLPLAGEVDLAIVRTQPGSEQSMDSLERSLQGVEEFMGTPLPVGYVTVLFEDSIHASGSNYRTLIAAWTAHDVGGALRILSHEVGHFYWKDNHGWINEGAVIFMSRILRDHPAEQWAEPTGFPFRFASNIAELEQPQSRGPVRPYLSWADAFLGERIFADLYRNLGDDAFRAGFRKLYVMSKGVKAGMRDLRDAFKAASPEAAAIIDTITARWYDGSEPYDMSFRDVSPVEPILNSIDGRVDRAYIALSQDGSPVSRFSAQGVTDVWLALEYSYQGDSQPLHLEIVESFEDGFVFRRREETVDTPAEQSKHFFHLPVGILYPKDSEANVPSPSELWSEYAPHGRYWVYVYHEGRKVAEVQYEVTP